MVPIRSVSQDAEKGLASPPFGTVTIRSKIGQRLRIFRFSGPVASVAQLKAVDNAPTFHAAISFRLVLMNCESTDGPATTLKFKPTGRTMRGPLRRIEWYSGGADRDIAWDRTSSGGCVLCWGRLLAFSLLCFFLPRSLFCAHCSVPSLASLLRPATLPRIKTRKPPRTLETPIK